MHVVTWILTGLFVGWLTRIAWGARDAGLPADLTLGALGAAAGGWLFHLLGMSGPEGGLWHVTVAALGALTVLMASRLLLFAASRAGATHPLSALEHQLLAKLPHARPVARVPNRTFDEQRTLGQRMADRLAAFGGRGPSWASSPRPRSAG